MTVNRLILVRMTQLYKIAVTACIPAGRNYLTLCSGIDIRSLRSCNIKSFVISVASEYIALNNAT